MNIAFFDDGKYRRFLPLTYTRPCADLRIGILKISEKWEKWLGMSNVGYHCRYPLNLKFSSAPENNDCLWINGRFLPDSTAATQLKNLPSDTALYHQDELLAFRTAISPVPDQMLPDGLQKIQINHSVTLLVNVWDIFQKNGEELNKDFTLITEGRKSAPIPGSNTIWNESQIFVEEGAWVEGAMLNALHGPIYIGKDTELMEGSVIRGPFALCEHSSVKLGAKIYGPTTVGPHSKVGGELNNVVIQGYSNKGHDGFLGNSVLGEWCNLGADTNNSNLKNNYAPVKLWDYESGRFKPTGLQFCGLIMGDHSKCGINTMFNTGTVVGVSANIFGAGFPRNFIPSFAWGGNSGFTTFKVEEALETARIMMSRRGIELSVADRRILEDIFNNSSEFRFWEK